MIWRNIFLVRVNFSFYHAVTLYPKKPIDLTKFFPHCGCENFNEVIKFSFEIQINPFCGTFLLQKSLDSDLPDILQNKKYEFFFSMAFYFRYPITDDGRKIRLPLKKVCQDLQKIAYQYNLVAVLTNQMTTRFQGNFITYFDKNLVLKKSTIFFSFRRNWSTNTCIRRYLDPLLFNSSDVGFL